MSNIFISIYRIFQKDGSALSLDKGRRIVEFLELEGPSYYVRPQIKISDNNLCCDIIYGTGKHPSSVELPEKFPNYHFWHRFNLGFGSCDDIEYVRLYDDEVSESRFCLYGFDCVKIYEKDKNKINLNGSYTAFEEGYFYKRFGYYISETNLDIYLSEEKENDNNYCIQPLFKGSEATILSDPNLNNLIDLKKQNQFIIEFLWQNKVVLRYKPVDIKKHNNALYQPYITNSSWCNCVDPWYLQFIKDL